MALLKWFDKIYTASSYNIVHFSNDQLKKKIKLRTKYYQGYEKYVIDYTYIEYYKFDQVIKVSFSINDFDLLYGSEFRGKTQALALIFRRNRKKILTQYQGGVWTKDKMVELYEFIRKEKIKNINKY